MQDPAAQLLESRGRRVPPRILRHSDVLDDVRGRGVEIPIVPGIMPIANFSKLARFADMCGAEIPRWLRLKLQSYADDTASIKALGLDVVTEMCGRLLRHGAPGLHFYTLNQAGLSSTICQRLGY